MAHSAPVNQILRSVYQTLFGDSITGTQLGTLEAALQVGTTTMAAVQSSLVAQAAADVPVLSDVVTNQSISENAGAVPLGALTLADPNAGMTETVTVSLTGGAAHFTDYAGSLNPAGTVFTRSGTAQMIQGDLRVLTMANATPGSIATLRVKVENSAGHSANDTVTITTQALRSTSSNNMLFMPSATGLTVMANAGFETFAFPTTGFGQDTITGFDLVHDMIQLPRPMAATFTNLQSNESAIAGGTLISFGTSGSVTLAGITPTSLHASNFQFA